MSLPNIFVCVCLAKFKVNIYSFCINAFLYILEYNRCAEFIHYWMIWNIMLLSYWNCFVIEIKSANLLFFSLITRGCWTLELQTLGCESHLIGSRKYCINMQLMLILIRSGIKDYLLDLPGFMLGFINICGHQFSWYFLTKSHT